MASSGAADEMATILWEEIQRDAGILGRQLFDGLPADARELSQREYQAYVRRNWADGGFRQALRTRLGAAEFLRVARVALEPAAGDIEP